MGETHAAAGPERPDEEAARVRRAELFGVLHDADASAQQRSRAREALVCQHLYIVEHCARRFRNRGEPLDDLRQVGTIGLIKAIDRFDPAREFEFSTYATPTIIGEIKRHFRDKGWAVRVPRQIQELRSQVAVTSAQLHQELGRSPLPRELATQLDCSVEQVIEALEAASAYSPDSLDAGSQGSGRDDFHVSSAASRLAGLGSIDGGLRLVELRESLRPLLAELDDREKQILLLRFFRNRSQAQIAEDLAISQMHVSRLLNRTLTRLRDSLERR